MTMLQEPMASSPRSSASASNEAVAGTRRPTRVAVVDDDEDFRRTLSFYLSDEGLEAVDCPGSQAALELLSTVSVDVILLDWRMPDMNGLELLRELRQRGVTTPAIFLTGLTDEVFEEAALAGGAVDFVEKTRKPSILLRRIELIAEAQRPLPEVSQQRPLSQVKLGHLELRFDTNRATWRGVPVELTLTEFRMISHLAMRSGEDVGYRQLYDLVHGKDFIAGFGSDGYRTNVRTFIKRIRRKFRELDSTFDCIDNYARFGYRWTTR